jgi:radical SAM protein with 4Fe4S-binding SPASM domain
MKTFETERCRVLEDLNDLAYEKCIPVSVTLELTLKCNIRCTHCYNFDREAPRPAAEPELSFDEVLPLLDQLRQAGTLFLGLTGGEALVHPRFWDILDEAAARNFAVNVLSNGTLLTESVCDRLTAYPSLWLTSLSVYGARAATHDAVTRSRGSFRRTIDGARRIRDRGGRLLLKFIVMRANAAEVGEMVALADREEIPYSVDTTITGRYDGTMGSLATRVDPPTLAELYQGPLRHLLTARRRDPTDEEFKCNCARVNGAVSSSGDVYPCIAAPWTAGNVRERPFGEIWRNSPVFQSIRGFRIADFKTCSPCPLKRWCHRSPGPAYLLTGDYTSVDPWSCQEAQIIHDILG